MNHKLSKADQQFLIDFNNFNINPDQFHHREHIKLAYILLVKNEVATAHAEIKALLLAFLQHLGVPEGKYHETMTYAWLLAVRHFMHMSPQRKSADEFIAANPLLLDKNIMFTHYSEQLIWSKRARLNYVEPDLDPIPLYKNKLA